jgi:alpha,alpha-trehalase
MSRAVLWVALLVVATTVVVADDELPIPSVLFGHFFQEVQLERLYADQKVFCDAIALEEASAILYKYETRPQPVSQLLDRYFVVAQHAAVRPPPNMTMREHIVWLWPYLTRRTLVSNSSLVPLPHSYIVPGSRFTELFYWDTYFVLQGLSSPQDHALKEGIIDNFAYLIDRFGFVPNGNRNYLQSRSQPPFFSLMVREMTFRPVTNFALQLRREYRYWMRPERVVRMPDGAVLNRYWDALDVPRDESYWEDVTMCRLCRGGVGCGSLYRDIRSAAESGWDFSSRWLANKTEQHTMCSVRTTAILPVDLNALLFHLEETLAEVWEDATQRHEFERLAAARRKAVEKYMWCEEGGFYCDFDIGWNRTVHESPTGAMMFPLFVRLASPERAARTAATMREVLLRKGGLVATTHETGQQWDYPMGWAPLQWVAVQGLASYGMGELAVEKTFCFSFLRFNFFRLMSRGDF